MEATENLEITLNELSRKLSEVRIRSQERAVITHERFNVFTTLLKENDEVRLHTRFIHNLLDPDGTHDCGRLFLDLFFEVIEGLSCENDPQDIRGFSLASNSSHWRVSKEKRIGNYGQLDMLLESAAFGIAIENKIHAYEQDTQLESYAAALCDRYENAWKLIYLTLDGKSSGTANGQPYIRMSYSEHILEWLERCLQATYHKIPINQIILQYRQVVRSLTGNTLDSENMKTIVEIIRSNPDLIRHKVDIQKSIDEAIRETWKQLAKEIQEGLKDLYDVVPDEAATASLSLVIKVVPPATNRLADAPFTLRMESDEWCLGFGVFPMNSVGSAPSGHLALFARMLDVINKDANIMELNQQPPTPAWPVGWHNLLKGTPEQQVAQYIESKKASQICAEIKTYAGMLENAYVQAV